MKATLKMDSPGNMQCTLTMTTSLNDWREIAAALNGKWPGSELSDVIYDTVRKAEKSFIADTEPGE